MSAIILIDMSDWLSLVKDISIIIAGLVALITFVRGVAEYANQGHEKRATQFVDMRRRYLETQEFQVILELLINDDPKLSDINPQQRRNFLGFIEEIALMVNSGLIREEVAHYMFGRYVCLANKSENLWKGLDRDSLYWEVFRRFASQMECQSKKSPKEMKDLRL